MSAEERDPTIERRVARRLLLLPRAVFSTASGQEGTGLLYDISATGARLEHADPQLSPSTRLRMTFALRGAIAPIEVHAEVVRKTERGFAVQFIDLDGSVEKCLEEALASLETLSDR